MNFLKSILLYKGILVAIATLMTASYAQENAISMNNIPDSQLLMLMEKEALESDQLSKNLLESRKMYHNKSIESGTLPDPKIGLSFKNIPTNSFDFSQENMTQVAIGIKQMVPGGNKLDLKSKINDSISTVVAARYDFRQRQVLLLLRNQWLKLVFLNKKVDLLIEKKKVLNNLKQVTESLFRVGKKDQQDVFQAEVELNKVSEDLIEQEQMRQVAISKIKRWVTKDEQLWQNIRSFPDWNENQNIVQLRTRLLQNPLFLSSKRTVDVSRNQLKLAEQSYKPDWNIGISYGSRSGNNLNGTPRSDFISLDFSMDLPLFTENRQDKQVLASQNAFSAADWDQQNVLENIRTQLDTSWRRLNEINKRIRFYNEHLVDSSMNHSQAAMNAYQRDAADFSDPMVAYINEIKIKTDLEKLYQDKYQQLAQIRFLTGENQ